MDKIKSIEEIEKISSNLRKEGKTIVFTNGCFDILHPGHIKVLKKAKSIGDILIVGLNSDKSIRMIKGKKRPIIDQKGRCEILSSLSMVDYIVIFEEKTPEKLIKAILPNFIVKGADYKKEEVVGKDIIERYGGKIVIVPLYKKYSTTNLIKKINENFKDC
ncbi:MAG: D-glycero-beta-D-manno-heptose 1-phosphate adenylyltransferase [Candidatus Ratteibacteria bacterium]